MDNRSTETKLHLFGNSILAVLVTSVFYGGTSFSARLPVWFLLLALLSFAAFAVGFSLYIWPSVQKLWCTRFGKAILSVLFTIILFAAQGASRELVAEALGLPPSDFEFSVTVWTLFFAVLLWLLLAAVVLIPVNLVYVFRTKKTRLNINRGMGAHSLLITCLFSAVGLAQVISDLNGPIRWVAFLAEYHNLSAYPSLEPEVRSKLHENGVVSYAELHDGMVSIRVVKLPQ